MRLRLSGTVAGPETAFAWIAAAAAVACAAVVLALADVPALSMLLALVGLPIGAYAALAAPSRAWIAMGLAALTADLVVLGYWAYVLFDALQGAR